MNNHITPIKYQSVVNNDYYLNNYLKTGNIEQIYPVNQNQNQNYNKIINYFNIYNYLNNNKNLETGDLFLTQIDNYFTDFLKNSNLDLKNKLLTYLYEIQTLWFYPEIKNKKWITYFSLFMKNLVQYYLNQNNYSVDNSGYTKYLNVTSLFVNLLTTNFDYFQNENENEKEKNIIGSLNQDIIISMLDDCSNYNDNFNILDLNSLVKLNLKQSSKLINLSNIKEKLKYQETSNMVSFDKNIIIDRIKKNSNGLITDSFPFDSKSFMISGGFAINSIIDIVSDYTDIDIYIFSEFEDTVEKLINYFSLICDIKMTHNSSIINIYPINYNMNIQLIKINGNPQSIINEFDLSYTQIAILDWDNIIMTNKAVKALITGYFTLNRNNVIRSYRIIKAYVKGFTLDPKEFHQVFIDNNKNKFTYKLLDEVKDIIKNLYETYVKFNKNIVYNFNNIKFNNLDSNLSDEHIISIENLLMNYLNDELVNKLMTKSVILTSDIINKYVLNQNYDLFKCYLESLTLCNYFDKKDLYNIGFKDLSQYHINYEHKCFENVLKEDTNYYYPDSKDISVYIYNLDCKKIINSFPLIAISCDYYRIQRKLENYCINLKININNFKLINKYGQLTFSIETSDTKLNNIIKNLDSRLEEIYKKIIGINGLNNIKSSFLKKNKEIYRTSTIKVNISFEDFVNKLIIKNSNLEYNKISNIKKFSKYCINQIKNTKFNTLSEFGLLKKFKLIQSDNLSIRLNISDLISEEQINNNTNYGEKHLLFKYNINIHDICFVE